MKTLNPGDPTQPENLVIHRKYKGKNETFERCHRVDLPPTANSVFFKVSQLKTCQYDSFRQKVKYNCSITFRNFMVIGLFYTIRNNLESLSPLFNTDLLQHEIERLRSVSLPYLPSVLRLLLHRGDGSISSVLRLLLHGGDGSNVV